MDHSCVWMLQRNEKESGRRHESLYLCDIKLERKMNGRDTLNDPLCVQKTLKEVNLVRIFFRKNLFNVETKILRNTFAFQIRNPSIDLSPSYYSILIIHETKNQFVEPHFLWEIILFTFFLILYALIT